MSDHPLEKDIWTLEEAASFLNINVEKARKMISSNGLTPIQTHTGVGYQSDDIRLISPRSNNRPGD